MANSKSSKSMGVRIRKTAAMQASLGPITLFLTRKGVRCSLDVFTLGFGKTDKKKKKRGGSSDVVENDA